VVVFVPDGAGDELEKRLKRLLADPPLPSPRTAYDYYSLGVVFDQHADYGNAERCARLAVGTVEPLLRQQDSLPGRLILFRSLGLLGTALRQQGAYEQAEEPLVRAIELAEAMPDRPELTAEAWNNLGVLCKYAGWFDRGMAAYARAMSLAQGTPETPGKNMLLAAILHNTGGLDHARGRFESAEEPARRAWEIRREFLGEEHLSTLADAVAYAGVLDGLSRYAESRPIYARALEVYERAFGPDHYETAATLHNLAFVEYAEGHRERAIELARRAYSIKAKLLGEKHPDTALSAMNLASLLPPEEEREARTLLSEALRTFEGALTADHPHTARCKLLLNRAG
jgi:tetratricopeptide (TPR) repeat protein